MLVAIGACAMAGGIQALRNFADVEEFTSVVYARPEYISTLATSTPIVRAREGRLRAARLPDRPRPAAGRDHRPAGRPARPALPNASVCTECKRRGTTCVMVAEGTPCLGPVTHAGCGAICPAIIAAATAASARWSSPNVPALIPFLRRSGMSDGEVGRVFATFNVAAPGFAAGLEVANEDDAGRGRAAMSHRSRQLTVSALARVEGEGALRVTLRDGEVERAELNIYEPPRFFEALLRGRAGTEPPDITARICGICPVAYQTSACNALEALAGVQLEPELAALRRLLYLR